MRAHRRRQVGLVMLMALIALMHVATGQSQSPNEQRDVQDEKEVPAVLKFTMDSLNGEPVKLSKYHGKVILVVNTASKCGFTPQYKELEELYQKYKDRGLVVLGFPSNDFGNQEPGTDEQIGRFCEQNYGVTFDMFSKVVVKGAEKVPLYKYLTEEQGNPHSPGEIKWNFEKFLIGRDGQVVGRYASRVKPMGEEIVKAVETEIAKEK